MESNALCVSNKQTNKQSINQLINQSISDRIKKNCTYLYNTIPTASLSTASPNTKAYTVRSSTIIIH